VEGVGGFGQVKHPDPYPSPSRERGNPFKHQPFNAESQSPLPQKGGEVQGEGVE
jgi:hypothetical protein